MIGDWFDIVHQIQVSAHAVELQCFVEHCRSRKAIKQLPFDTLKLKS